MATRLDGMDSMTTILARVAQNLPQRAAAALYQEAEAVMAIAKSRTPIRTGVLRASGYVSEPTTSGGSISVELGFGGAASDYAIAAHEHLSEHSPPSWKAAEANGHGIHWSVTGTGPKFLEGPLQEAAPQLADRIGRRIELG